MVGDATAGLAGLASAGEDRDAEPQLLLAMETALVSISDSLVKLGPLVLSRDGVEEGTDVGGKWNGPPVTPPSSRSQGSSIAGTSESMAGITSARGSFTALIPGGVTKEMTNQTSKGAEIQIKVIRRNESTARTKKELTSADLHQAGAWRHPSCPPFTEVFSL